jgi:predicted Zn-dependent protease
VISRRSLVSALNARKVADWVVIERGQELATIAEDRALHRTEQRTRWTIVVHHDVPRGRGTARLDLATRQGEARDVVEQAISLATAAVGPPWISTPAAAPAKVTLLDDKLAKVNLATAAAELLAAAKRPAGANVQLRLELMRERVNVQSESGFHTTWTATNLTADALVAVGDHSIELTRDARRRADLEAELTDALASAASDLTLLGSAGAPTPGRCAVILRADALLHGGGLGMWRVFAEHAAAETERQGLARYRQGTAIAPGADQIAEPLTITSNGALDFGAHSAPVDDEGEAVRRFALIERGVATGLGLSAREAARRKVEPNGGVRNLVIARGTWTDAAPAGRTIEVRRLRSLSIDPYTGDASLELGLSIDRDGNRPFTGGTLRLDLVAALARARRSSAALRRGPYLGPASVVIEDVELLV